MEIITSGIFLSNYLMTNWDYNQLFMTHHRLAIFASGSGTNAENIIRYFKANENIEVSMVLTNNPHAGVIKRAKDMDVPVVVFTKSEFYNTSVISVLLKENNVTFVVLAGFLWLIPDEIIRDYSDRIINIHPALLPKYGGRGMFGDHVHQAVKSNFDKETGITIHFVNEHYDEGKIIFQTKCDIDPVNESIEEIAAKVHQLEYKHFPEIIEQVLTQIK
jgi:phosphoribosylglycinamide formyltransferase 1